MRKKHPNAAGKLVLFSAVGMAALFAVSLLLYTNRTGILLRCAASAASRGDYEKAISLAEAADPNDESVLSEYRYRLAESDLEAGKFKEAEAMFAALSDYGDSRARVSECRYRAALLLFEQEDYEAAKDAFYALAGYADALDRYDACRYAIADRTEESDPEAAFSLFDALGSFQDAAARAEAIAMRVTGESDPETALRRMRGVSDETLEQIRTLDAVREALPKGRLAVGFYHTVGLKADGTVLAVGRSSEGQCDVSAWSDVLAVDCGAYHTAALLKNGTVVACGRNTEGQCDTDGWTDVVAIVCTDYNTVGLRSDGTVVSVGFQAFSELSGWQNITLLGGGSYAVCGMTESGQVLSSHPSMRSESMRDLVALDVHTGYCVGLLPDGTVLCTVFDLPWTDVAAISACSTGVLGLTKDGAVLAHWFRERDAIPVSNLCGVTAIAAGGAHCAFLLADGSVVARGANTYGECNVDGWDLGATELD